MFPTVAHIAHIAHIGHAARAAPAFLGRAVRHNDFGGVPDRISRYGAVVREP